MSIARYLQRSINVLFVLVCISIGVTSYIAIRNIVADQSRIQNEALSTIFPLISDEVIKPLNIAETIANGAFFDHLLDQESIDEQALIAHLKVQEDRFGLVFFAASEKARRQYMSNGKTLNLIKDEVFWYFAALDNPNDIIADLGQLGDIHLYFDVKIYNEKHDFIGIVGVGKSLKNFLSKFIEFKKIYGYDFLIVSDKDEILLTSIESLVIDSVEAPRLQQLSWYHAIDKTLIKNGSLNSLLVNIENNPYLISDIHMGKLNWRILLLIPLEARQAQITRTFIINCIIIFLMAVILYLVNSLIIRYFKHRVEQSIELDPLTGINNRKGIQRRFDKFVKMQKPLGIILLDIDHFKAINDVHGHNTGDEVIQKIAEILQDEIRENDIAGRWGGEEFIILVPCEKSDTVKYIAERARLRIAQTSLFIASKTVTVTCSFGYTFTSNPKQLTVLVASADRALYVAKTNGRNRVEYDRPIQQQSS